MSQEDKGKMNVNLMEISDEFGEGCKEAQWAVAC